jgi:hypothetical protein
MYVYGSVSSSDLKKMGRTKSIRSSANMNRRIFFHTYLKWEKEVEKQQSWAVDFHHFSSRCAIVACVGKL